jgi:hypothetical protein
MRSPLKPSTLSSDILAVLLHASFTILLKIPATDSSDSANAASNVAVPPRIPAPSEVRTRLLNLRFWLKKELIENKKRAEKQKTSRTWLGQTTIFQSFIAPILIYKSSL